MGISTNQMTTINLGATEDKKVKFEHYNDL